MKRDVRIMGDSTCDLTPEMREKLKVGFMPLPVNVGDEARKDMENVFPEEIFAYYKETGKLCTTSAPNSMDYHEFWKPYLTQYPNDDIIHFHISSEMTSTYLASHTASQEYDNVYSIDTRSVSIGVALLIMEACEMRDAGMSAPEIVEAINKMKSRVQISFVVETIEYLWKGGRCSNLAGIGASLLQLRPGIDLIEGKLMAGKKYRGNNAAVFRKLVENALKDQTNVDPKRVFIANTSFDKEVNDYVESLIRENQPDVQEVISLQPGCSICVHCGPGTLALAWLQKEPI